MFAHWVRYKPVVCVVVFMSRKQFQCNFFALKIELNFFKVGCSIQHFNWSVRLKSTL